jgi:CHASE1-domain containing sensor protein
MGLAKFFDRSSPSWRSIIAVVAASGIALSFLGWQVAHEREERFARQEFDARANDRFLALQSGIDQYLNDMLALRASFQTFQPDREQFQSFAEQLFDDKNAMLAASWLPRVTRQERAEHERRAVEDGLADYHIRSVAADGSLSIAPDAPEYFPILYTSKVGASAAVYGLNAMDGGLRQQALERARDGDRPAATAIFELRRGEGNRNGFVIALPVYRRGAPHDTLDNRRENLIGIVQGVFQVSVLVNTILEAATTPAGLDASFFPAKPAPDSLPFYVHHSRLYDEESPVRSFAEVERGLHWSGNLRIADRDWVYVAAPRPGGIGTPSHFGSLLFLIGSLALTGIVGAYLWTVGRNASRLEASNRALDRAVGDLDGANARLGRAEFPLRHGDQQHLPGARLLRRRPAPDRVQSTPDRDVWPSARQGRPRDHVGRDPRTAHRGRYHADHGARAIPRLARLLRPVRQVERYHRRPRRRPRHPHLQTADARWRLGRDP